ncbi:serine hydrolase [Microcoleus sp. LEGE 07076]|uniref:serine hydrolase n=1 Tax=Microcoleus sp. LEGE 07076 TaxID=915322 RepID=UPI00188101A8|nr:serine hydrolase [Microcoleus sp. LEGE 07076]MBE9188120.1 serine hydrolase [Microcoleus sp. LEGE 07076]
MMRNRISQIKDFSLAMPFIPYLFYLVIPTCLIGIMFYYLTNNKVSDTISCKTNNQLGLTQSNPQNIQTDIRSGETTCYHFDGVAGQNIMIDTTSKTALLTPNNNQLVLLGTSQYTLQETGTYTLKVTSSKDKEPYQLKIALDNQGAIATFPAGASKYPSSSNPDSTVRTQLSYNVKNPPSFKSDWQLQKIVDAILGTIQAQGLSTSNLSISLVKLSDSNCCAYGSYSDNQAIFPASVSKLFWLAALYGQYNAGILPEGTISEGEIYKMIQDSDNEPASRVVDTITATESGTELTPEELKNWIDKRLWVNHFFETAGYRNINVSQKNFPIPYLKLQKPDKGRDLQIRGKGTVPIRNYLTSFDVARLLYEIDSGQAVSKGHSTKIKKLLSRDLNPDVWKKKEYNSIAGFFAESLPQDSRVFSKVGWTLDSRQDAAIIESPDGKVRYILVIFADNRGFADNWKIFPNISRQVYDRMVNYRSN